MTKLLRKYLTLYIFRAVVFYPQVYFQLTVQCSVLILLHVSATKRSHLQGDTIFEDIYFIRITTVIILNMVAWTTE